MPEKYGTMDVWADEIRCTLSCEFLVMDTMCPYVSYFLCDLTRQRIENLRAAGQMITPCSLATPTPSNEVENGS